jgi:hypothetical protein
MSVYRPLFVEVQRDAGPRRLAAANLAALTFLYCSFYAPHTTPLTAPQVAR